MKRSLLAISLIAVALMLLLPITASAQIPQWQPNTYYAVGALVMYNGVEYQCIQAHTSQVGWEPPNAPALWQPVSGGGGSCSSVPSSPTGLTAPSTTSSGTTLSWAAVSPPANCTITNYTVYENGSSIGTTTSTSFAVTGLSASTTYSFAVAATDSAGISTQSAAINVTTQSSGGGGGSGCASPWSSSQVYTQGMTASENGINYIANWWTQGQDPANNNGPAGSGQPWTSQGSCSACSTVPNAPTGLAASNTTSNSAQLSWTAATAASNCTVSSYTVYKNGSSIGSVSGTSFTVTGLSAQTTYQFTVAAVDSAGTSFQSSSISVTTAVGSSGGGGTAPGFIYAVYKDVTINADFNTGLQRSAVTGTVQAVTSVMPNKTLIWSFATGTCGSESWAGITTAMEVTNVQAFVNAGKNYIISTGGANGVFDCPSGQALINFINTYNSANLVGIDFDIEGGQSQQVVDDLITATMAAEQQFPNLQFSFTIPSLGSPSANPITGGGVGTTVVNEIKRLGLGGNYVVNLMAMDYGSTNSNNCVVVNNLCDMGQSAIAAAQALNQQSGIPLSHIGLTVDIGQNDTQDEVTGLANVDTMLSFVKSSGLATARFWSFDRDTPNGSGSSTSNGNGDPALAYNNEYIKDLGVQ